jgi:poly(ADP-ribose) glycohydrolase
VPLLQAGVAGEVVLSRELVRSILANSFFGNVRDFADQVARGDVAPVPPLRFAPGEWGTLDWYFVQSYAPRVAVERVKCMLYYFQCWAQQPLSVPVVGEVRFRRAKGNFVADLLASDRPVGEGIAIHVKGMEGPSPVTKELAGSIVDFANEDLHIGTIIPSATQEEILFSCRPELFPGVMFCQRMMPDEAIVITGAPRVVNYTGYLHTFRFHDGFPNAIVDSAQYPPQAIIAIDAVLENQFSRASIERDVNKAYVGFSCPIEPVSAGRSADLISTGGWGCGAFGGDQALKFLQ